MQGIASRPAIPNVESSRANRPCRGVQSKGNGFRAFLFQHHPAILRTGMPDEFQFDVFLSHSAKDQAVVRPLAERLRKDGVKVWFDEWVLKPGDSIPAKIEEGLEHSRVLVLCMSAQAFGSDWAQLESGMFRFRDPLNKERRFLPLRLDDYAHEKETGHFPKILIFAVNNVAHTSANHSASHQRYLAEPRPLLP